jgi:hypothetical protein
MFHARARARADARAMPRRRGASATNGQNNGANNTLLQNSAAKACYANRANTTFLSTAANGCVGNQGYYSLAGYSQLSQMGVAAAMAGVCTAAGGCDFLMNTGGAPCSGREAFHIRS